MSTILEIRVAVDDDGRIETRCNVSLPVGRYRLPGMSKTEAKRRIELAMLEESPLATGMNVSALRAVLPDFTEWLLRVVEELEEEREPLTPTRKTP